MGRGHPPRDRQHSGCARLVPVPRRRGPGAVRRQGEEPAQPLVELLRRPRPLARAHAPAGARRGLGRVDRRQERGRGLLLGVQPHPAAQADVQHPAQGRQELPVPGSHARRGMAACDGAARARSARACGTSGRTRTRTRSARRSTCCCEPSRSARARVRSSTVIIDRAARACTRTSRSARRRASGTSTTRSTTSSSRSSSTSSTASTTRSSSASSSGCRTPRAISSSSSRRGLRDQLTSVRKAIERQQMVGSREEDFDLIGIDDDALEASVQVFYVRRGRVVGRKGVIVDKVEDVETPALDCSHRRAALRGRRTCRCAPRDPRAGRTGGLRALRAVPRARTVARRYECACRSVEASVGCCRLRR